MSRYVDIDTLKIPSKEMIAKWIANSAPSIDICFCKECRYWQDYKGEHFCNNMYGLHEDTNADDFCSYGEREGE